jgi:DNA-directed RNA polymerase specialized sigma24 family protein
VFPDHALPVEAKHYYAREAHSRPDSDPLSHPKVEVAYQTSRTDETLHLTDENLAQLDEELTEWLYGILGDAGLDLRANEHVYVEDEYFSVENATTTASVVDLDLTEVRHEQEAVVYRHLAGGMAPTDQECLDVLVSDGGQVSPQDLAESTGRHEDTVYNALARMNDLVTHTRGEVSLKSTYTSELVADALDQAQQAVDTAAKTAADAVHASKRGLDNATSAFVAWCERYGVNYDDNGDDMHIDLGRVDSIEEVRNIIRSGFDRWCNMNREAITFKSAKVGWETEDGDTDLNYLPSSSTVNYHSQRAFTLLK